MQEQVATNPGAQSPTQPTTAEQAGQAGQAAPPADRSNSQFLSDMLAMRGEQMTAEAAAAEEEIDPRDAEIARLSFKDNMQDNMRTFEEILPEGTNAQKQMFVEGLIKMDTVMILNAAKNAALASVEAEQRSEPPRNLQVEGGGSGRTGQGSQTLARSMSDAVRRMRDMFA